MLSKKPDDLFPQGKIIQLMKALGYSASDEGVCAGITTMNMQAISTGHLNTLLERLHYIRDTPNDQLIKNIETARNNIREGIYDISENDRKHIDLLAYLEGVLIHQDTSKLLFLFDKPLDQSPKHTQETGKYTASKEMTEKKDELVRIAHFNIIQTKDEIQQSFEKLNNVLHNVLSDQKQEDCITVSISNRGPLPHRILLMRTREKLFLIDPNKLPMREITPERQGEELYEAMMFEKAYQNINSVFHGEYQFPIHFDVFTTTHSSLKKELETKLASLKNNFVVNDAKTPENKDFAYMAAFYGDADIIPQLEKFVMKKVAEANPSADDITLEKLSRKELKPFFQARTVEIAFEKGNEAVVNQLLALPDAENTLKAFINQPLLKEMLMNTVKNGHTNLVKLLLDYKADPNAKSGDDLETPLPYSPNKEIAQLLLNAKANINEANTFKNNALHIAAMKAPYEVFSLLLEQPTVNIQEKNNTGFSLLHSAFFSGDIKKIRLLLERKADLYATSNHGRSVIHFAAATRGHPYLLDFLIKEYKFPIHVTSKTGATPLEVALDNKNMEGVEQLLQYGAYENLSQELDQKYEKMISEHVELKKLLANARKTELNRLQKQLKPQDDNIIKNLSTRMKHADSPEAYAQFRKEMETIEAICKIHPQGPIDNLLKQREVTLSSPTTEPTTLRINQLRTLEDYQICKLNLDITHLQNQIIQDIMTPCEKDEIAKKYGDIFKSWHESLFQTDLSKSSLEELQQAQEKLAALSMNSTHIGELYALYFKNPSENQQLHRVMLQNLSYLSNDEQYDAFKETIPFISQLPPTFNDNLQSEVIKLIIRKPENGANIIGITQFLVQIEYIKEDTNLSFYLIPSYFDSNGNYKIVYDALVASHLQNNQALMDGIKDIIKKDSISGFPWQKIYVLIQAFSKANEYNLLENKPMLSIVIKSPSDFTRMIKYTQDHEVLLFVNDYETQLKLQLSKKPVKSMPTEEQNLYKVITDFTRSPSQFKKIIDIGNHLKAKGITTNSQQFKQYIKYLTEKDNLKDLGSDEYFQRAKNYVEESLAMQSNLEESARPAILGLFGTRNNLNTEEPKQQRPNDENHKPSQH